MSYAVTGDGVAHYPVDYEICSMGESHPDEMRASIKASRQKAGIPDDKLQGELVTFWANGVGKAGDQTAVRSCDKNRARWPCHRARLRWSHCL